MANKPLVELDFDAIKASLIAYFKNDPTFTDYNFEGSALNALVDVLAYNTHTNAYYANMLHSEGFLDSAQKRSSVVSRAKELGYTPKSVTCSTAYVTVTINYSGVDSLYLPRGTSFTASNENGSYKFLTVTDYYSTLVNGYQTFLNVKLCEGTLLSNSFVVNTTKNVRSIFSIPNLTCDTSTLKVNVYDSTIATTSIEYKSTASVFDPKPTSHVYFTQESYDGKYQIYFGSDIIGKQPVNGNMIVAEYISTTKMALADNCRLFYIDGISGYSILNITTTQVSFGGSAGESIESIKYRAVNTNTTKNRIVTKSDYETQLVSLFPYIKSAKVWGGENNVPPVYGKVFVSIQPVSGYTISDQIKSEIIIPAIKERSIMTVTPEFVDPIYTDLEFISNVKYSPNNISLTKTELELLVKQVVIDYVSSISTFDSDYLESELLSKISSIDSGIVSVNVQKKIGSKLTPLINTETRHQKYLNNKITVGSLTSTRFNIYHDSSIITVYMTDYSGVIGLYNLAGVLIKTIGTINYTTGALDFTFSLYSYLNDNRFIYIRAIPTESDLTCSRNQILTLQSDMTDSIIGISSNNVVNLLAYSK